MTRSTIFLDIDGVLTNHATGFRYGDAMCVALLNFITFTTGAAIVVSSTWRHDPDIAAMLASWGVTGEVIGITPDMSHARHSGIAVAVERGTEIARWIAQNDPKGPFVILDDDNDMGDLSRYSVRTDSQKGLQRNDAVMAVLMLQNCDHPCPQYFEINACPCTDRTTRVDEAVTKVVADVIRAHLFSCGECGWKGTRSMLIWSVPRRYICPSCHSDKVQRIQESTTA